MKKHICLFLFSLFALTLSAERITRDQALVLAQDFMQGKVMEPVHSSTFLAPARGQAYNESFYLFNAADGEGYVIISADNRICPVLGYSDHGNISMDDMPDNMKEWLELCKKEIENLTVETPYSPDYNSIKTEIAPLIKTKWYQDNPYNLECPVYDGERSVTGCAATALAQVLYYHKWPSQIVDSIPSYTHYYTGDTIQGLPPTTLKWDLMKLSYDNLDYTEGAYAIAELMRYCGQALRMAYFPDGSSADFDDMVPALIHYFNYNPIAEKVERFDYSDQDWENLIYSELKAGRPVLYMGISTYTAHAFVCDGYKDGYFHFNWGWGGKCDGYFKISLLIENVSRKKEDKPAFNFSHAAVIHVEPDTLDPLLGFSFCDSLYRYTIIGEREAMIQAIDQTDYSGIDTLMLPDHVDLNMKRYLITRLGRSSNHNYDIKTIYLPSSLNEIDTEASFLQSIEKIKIPRGIEIISSTAFRQNDLLKEITADPDNTRYKSSDGVLFSIDGKDLVCYPPCKEDTLYAVPSGVTSIGGSAFFNSRNIREIILPDGIEILSEQAFYNSSLRRINLPESLKSIHELCFGGCQYLDNLYLPKGLKSIGFGAMELCTSLKTILLPDSIGYSLPYNLCSWCKSLQTVTIPDCVLRFEDEVFSTCISLSSVNIPDSVYYLGNSVFFNCQSLTTVSIPDNVKTIGNKAFFNCISLLSVTIPDGVSKISEATFLNCYSLRSAVIKDNVTEIGIDAFRFCYELDTLVLPANLQSIGDYAFADCRSLTSLVIPEGTSSIAQGAFYACSSLREIVFSERLKSIGTQAFTYCSSLKEAVFPDSVTSIGDFAFWGCSSLESIYLPENLRYLGEGVFGDCSNLTTIYSYVKDPNQFFSPNDTIFYGVNEDCILYVPQGCSQAYENVIRCNTIREIREFDVTAVEPQKAVTTVPVEYYNLSGDKIPAPQRGINLIRYSDGTVRKITQ